MFFFSHLHDDEFKNQRQFGDVTSGQVEEEGSVPDRVRSTHAFGLLGADDFPVLSQVNDDVVICG